MKFSISGTKTPSHEVFSFGMVTSKGLNVRQWAGAEHDLCKTVGPLSQGDVVGICDKIEDSKGKPWYYVKIGSKFGFVSAGYVYRMPVRAYRFMCNLERYHKYIKANNRKFEYRYDSKMTSFSKVQEAILHGKIPVGITCLIPLSWAFKDMGIKRKDGVARVSGENGSFAKHFTGDFPKHFTRITTGGPIGKTVKQAVEQGLLLPGDVLTFRGFTHTFAYTGEGCLMYEGGHANIKNGIYTGIKPDYAKHYTKRIISDCLRWK